MKIDAQTFEEFFAGSGKFKDIMVALDSLILQTVPGIDRKLYNSPSMCFIGYAAMDYNVNKTFGGKWPMISIAPQKNTANLYVMAAPVQGKYLAELYVGKLGKVSIGKSCIRIKKWEDVNMVGLENLLKEAMRWYHAEKGKQLPDA